MFKNFKVYNIQIEASLNDISRLNELVKEFVCPNTSPTKLKTVGVAKPFEQIDPTTNFIENIEGYGYGHVRVEERAALRGHVSIALNKEVKRRQSAGETITSRELRKIKRDVKAQVKASSQPSEALIPYVINLQTKELWVITPNIKYQKDVTNLFAGMGIPSMERTLSLQLEFELTNLVKEPNRLPEHFDLGYSCQMKHLGEKSMVTYRRQELSSEEVMTNINKAKDINRIQLVYRDSIAFQIRQSQDITALSYNIGDVNEFLEIDLSDDDEVDYLGKQRTIVGFHIQCLSHLIPKIYSIFCTLEKGQDEFVVEEIGA